MVLRKHEARPRAWGGGLDGRSGAPLRSRHRTQAWVAGRRGVGLRGGVGGAHLRIGAEERVSGVWRGVCGGRSRLITLGHVRNQQQPRQVSMLRLQRRPGFW